MRHGFFTSFALDDFFLTVTSVEISNSLKNHDALRENGENFVAKMSFNSFGKFSLQYLRKRSTFNSNGDFLVFL